MIQTATKQATKGKQANCNPISISKDKCGISNTTTRDTYKKRARAKYSQQKLIKALVKLDSPLKKSYEDSLFCSYSLMQYGNTFTAKYCKHRWCKVCNRVRTAELLNGYERDIKAMEAPQFLTLTIPNVPAESLKQSIKEMLHTVRKIQDLRRKQKKPLFQCIRKLECTYNPDRNDFHPHLHFIIESEKAALEFRTEWLIYYPSANNKGQDIRPAHKPIELFKYFAKLTSKSKKDKKELFGKKLIAQEWHYPEALDIIFQAIKGMRIIQPMGEIRYIEEDIKEIDSQTMEGEQYEIQEAAIWKWHRIGGDGEKITYDWVNTYTGELLTNFVPDDRLTKYTNRIRYLTHD
jgi:hypothetical protein